MGVFPNVGGLRPPTPPLNALFSLKVLQKVKLKPKPKTIKLNNLRHRDSNPNALHLKAIDLTTELPRAAGRTVCKYAL